jgi:hypothetical protein
VACAAKEKIKQVSNSRYFMYCYLVVFVSDLWIIFSSFFLQFNSLHCFPIIKADT